MCVCRCNPVHTYMCKAVVCICECTRVCTYSCLWECGYIVSASECICVSARVQAHAYVSKCRCACVPMLHFTDNSSCLVVMGTTVLKMLNHLNPTPCRPDKPRERAQCQTHLGSQSSGSIACDCENWTGPSKAGR